MRGKGEIALIAAGAGLLLLGGLFWSAFGGAVYADTILGGLLTCF